MTATNSWQLSHPLAELRCRGMSGTVDVSRPELGLHDVSVESRPLAATFFSVQREANVAHGNVAATNGERAWPLSVADAYVRGTDLVATYQPADDWPYAPQIYWRVAGNSNTPSPPWGGPGKNHCLPPRRGGGPGRGEPATALDRDNSPIASLSLLVSVQTHLLDTRPRIVVSSAMKCTEVFHLPPSSCLGSAGDAPLPPSPSRGRAGEGSFAPSPPLGRVGEGLLDSQAIPPQQRTTIQPTSEYCCIVRRLADSQFSYAEMMPASDFHELRVWQDDANDWHAEWELFSDFLEKGVIRRARVEGFLLPRERDLELAATYCEDALHLPLPLTT